tara:strand:+ start:2280 stop:2492 length:213 start_codon:yes stop_codon:yes gene_type:complete
METRLKDISTKEIRQLIQDVALLKEILLFNISRKDPEGELSDWAKKELEKSRKTSDKEYISMEEIEKEFL